MRNLILGFVASVTLIFVLTFTGCTFSLQGLNATDGDKTLNVDSLETTE